MISDARRLVATLAAPYLPRRPTETVLYKLVRQNLESFLAYAREHYDGGLPRYVENELRAFLRGARRGRRRPRARETREIRGASTAVARPAASLARRADRLPTEVRPSRAG